MHQPILPLLCLGTSPQGQDNPETPNKNKKNNINQMKTKDHTLRCKPVSVSVPAINCSYSGCYAIYRSYGRYFVCYKKMCTPHADEHIKFKQQTFYSSLPPLATMYYNDPGIYFKKCCL